jgi:hypothetical protein
LELGIVKKIIVVVMLSLVSASGFAQQVESPDRIFTDQRSYVAEPSARLARCGRMDFAEHLIDVYVGLFANSLRTPPALLRERLFKMSYEQYDLLQSTNWPDQRTASLECAAHTQRALELIARWNFQ